MEKRKKEKLTEEISEQLTNALTVTEIYSSLADAAEKIAVLQGSIGDSASESLDSKLNMWISTTIAAFELTVIDSQWEELNKRHKEIKLEILRAGASEAVSIRVMERRIELINLVRQTLESLVQSSETMDNLNDYHAVIPVQTKADTAPA